MPRRQDRRIGHVADWLRASGAELAGCQSTAQRFLAALDPEASAFAFRTFSDTPYSRLADADPLEHYLYGSLDTLWPRLLELNRRGAAISVTINDSDGRGRSAANITRVRALFVDDDRGLGAGHFPLTPQISVQTSPGHYHHYWLCRGLDPRIFRATQSALARRYRCDHRVTGLNQSMQLPGTWRRKSALRPLFVGAHIERPRARYQPQELRVLLDDAAYVAD
jgi:hypothetical protein